MAPDQHKPRKTASHKHMINCFSFKSCFGLPQGSKMAKKNDQTLVKYGKGRSSGRTRNRAVPITHHHETSFGTPSSTVVCSSKGIHVVEEDDMEASEAAPQSHQVIISNKVHDMPMNIKRSREMDRTLGSIKYEESRRTQDTWSSRLKMLRSISRLKEDKSREKFGRGGQLIGSNQLSPMVGALIMIAILIVILICGKICAIICTTAWFYTVPLIRATNSTLHVDELEVGSEHIDVDSPEYKKRVVLQGLLRRD